MFTSAWFSRANLPDFHAIIIHYAATTFSRSCGLSTKPEAALREASGNIAIN